ncbi:MAG: PEP-CTERM sorting domain-containing protein [Rhodobacteraceae bacterium]|nr:PEP-CTERM sorting domain-containing protein [Paracoccaceae bacterium]
MIITAAIPEPATIPLTLLGALGMVLAARRFRRR